MKSPYQRIVVYDLETGGLKNAYNPITEFAMVAIDLEKLEIVEEMQVTLSPRLDLSNREDESRNEAKIIFKNLAEPDEETRIKTMTYKGKRITLKSLEEMTEDIENFYVEVLDKRENLIFTYEEYKEGRENPKYKDVFDLYYDHNYNPGALDISHISTELMLEEGLPFEEACQKAIMFLERHTIGNSKPILAGHNIKKFDNDFFEKFFEDNDWDLKKFINPTRMIDTLDEARLKWFEAPNYTLGSCANMVGITHKDAHRALPDTIVNAKLLVKFLQSYRSNGEASEEYVRTKYDFNF